MNNVKTRNQSTYLYQDSDPVEDQIIWVKSESRNWVNNKITKLQDKKKVSETEESETMIMKNEKERKRENYKRRKQEKEKRIQRKKENEIKKFIEMTQK